MTEGISKFIELNNFLKIKGIAGTGGKAKLLIRSGMVKVNDEIETRNKRKLRKGDFVEYLGNKFTIDERFLI